MIFPPRRYAQGQLLVESWPEWRGPLSGGQPGGSVRGRADRRGWGAAAELWSEVTSIRGYRLIAHTSPESCVMVRG